MHALIHDPHARQQLRLGEAPDPEPRPHEAHIEVTAVSLNFGELLGGLMIRRPPA